MNATKLLLRVSRALLPALLLVTYVPAQELGSDLRDALLELRGRDQRTFRDLQSALKDDPEQARERLEQHARYLVELRRAKSESPRRYALLLEQQVSELEVRDALEAVSAAPDAERVAARERLYGLLEEGFELRHELRELQLAEVAEKLGAERARLAQIEESPESSRERWWQRIATERPEEMQELQPSPDELRALAPVIVHALRRRDPQRARQLARSAERSPDSFSRVLGRVLKEEPRLLDDARAEAPGEPGSAVRERERLGSGVRSARERMRRWERGEPRRREGAPERGPRRPVERGERGARGERGRRLPEGRQAAPTPEQRAELAPALDEIVEAELSLARLNLDQVEQRIAEMRTALEFRRENKSVIVGLHFAELLGERDRYDW